MSVGSPDLKSGDTLLLFQQIGTYPLSIDLLKSIVSTELKTGSPAFRIFTPIISVPVALSFFNEEINLLTVDWDIFPKLKSCLFTSTLMSQVSVEKFSANVAPIVAKKIVKVICNQLRIRNVHPSI